MLKTPVVFLIFCRPDLTARVFETIRQAKPSKLLIVADGARNEEEALLCKQTRAITEKIDWDCEVLRNYSDVNLGCCHRVASGISWAFEQVEEAIILEDDCLAHPSFFPYCETLLEYYRHDERVMMISGDNFVPNETTITESYLFSRYFAIWGWASWKRAWQKYDIEMKSWKFIREDKKLLKYWYPQKYLRNTIISLLDSFVQNKIDTWDIQWFYSCLINNGLSIVPRVNLVSNIGIVGTHSVSESFNHNLATFYLDCDRDTIFTQNYLTIKHEYFCSYTSRRLFVLAEQRKSSNSAS